MDKENINVNAVIVNPCRLNYYGTEIDAYVMCVDSHVLLVRKVAEITKPVQAVASSGLVYYNEKVSCSVEVSDASYYFKKDSIVLFNKSLPLFEVADDNQSIAKLTANLYKVVEECGLKDICCLLNGYYDFKDSRKMRGILAKCFTAPKCE